MIRIRQAEGRDTTAIFELYRQLVRPVVAETKIEVHPERIEEARWKR